MSEKTMIEEAKKANGETPPQPTSSAEAAEPKKKSAEELKKERDRKAAQGREFARQLEQVKKKAWEYEKTNHDKLILFRGKAGWWKLGGISALVYKNTFAPRLKKEPNLRDDTDFFATFADGVISIPSVDGFKKDMEKLELKISSETPFWIAYDLGFRISDTDIKQWREAEEEAKRRLQQLVMPEVPDPNLWLEILALVKIVYENVRKENAVMRECNGREMLAQGRKIIREFMKMSRGQVPQEEAVPKISAAVDEIEIELVMIIELRAWTTQAESRVAERIAKVKEILREKYDLKKGEKDEGKDGGKNRPEKGGEAK